MIDFLYVVGFLLVIFAGVMCAYEVSRVTR